MKFSLRKEHNQVFPKVEHPSRVHSLEAYMTEDFVECNEAVGKTVSSLKVFRDSGDGPEVQIDFSDGTSFNCCFNSKPTFEATLLRAGAGEPEVLRRFDDQ